MPYLIVKNRHSILYEGEVENVSTYNRIGVFNILLDHSNFMSLVDKEIIIKEKMGTTKKIDVTNGLVKVKENKIWIYLGIK